MPHVISSLKLDSNGDLDITNNTFNFITNESAVIQNIKSLLSIRKGEWFRNTQTGLSHENLFGKNINEELLRLDIVESISQESFVQSVDEVGISFNNKERKITITFVCTLNDLTNIEGEVIV